MSRLGIDMNELPRRMANINRILNVLPAVVMKEVLSAFYARMYGSAG